MYTLQKPLISLLVILLLTTSQIACTSTPLPPYEATYTTKLRGIKIKGVRKHVPNGVYPLKIFFVKYLLKCRFFE